MNEEKYVSIADMLNSGENLAYMSALDMIASSFGVNKAGLKLDNVRNKVSQQDKDSAMSNSARVLFGEGITITTRPDIAGVFEVYIGVSAPYKKLLIGAPEATVTNPVKDQPEAPQLANSPLK
jgi:hypothetical protein